MYHKPFVFFLGAPKTKAQLQREVDVAADIVARPEILDIMNKLFLNQATIVETSPVVNGCYDQLILSM